MAKYDWISLEREYILGNYKSVSDFLKIKNVVNNGTTRKRTSGWKGKKKQKEYEKTTKIVEKVLEKQSDKEAQQIINLNTIANDLALGIIKASKELNMHIARNKRRTKILEYDYKANKPKKEVVDEIEEVTSYMDIIDKQGLKLLTSALKDLKDIIPIKDSEDEDNSFIDALNEKAEVVWNEKEE